MVKVIVQMYPVMPSASEAERMAMRPIGRNAELFQQTLRGWCDIVEEAVRLGLWGVTAIEHHFHSEGYEVSPNPGVMNAFWGARTNNIRVGQLGYVMTTHNPIRVAEETAPEVDELEQFFDCEATDDESECPDALVRSSEEEFGLEEFGDPDDSYDDDSGAQFGNYGRTKISGRQAMM